MQEIEGVQAEQARLTAKRSLDDGDKAELLKLEGRLELLREQASTAHDEEVRGMREAIATARPMFVTGADVPADEVWRDASTGREIRALRPDQKLATSAGDGLSFGRALRAMAIGSWKGAEAEVRALSEGLGTAGGYLMPDVLSTRVIDLARAKSVAVQSGVRTIPFTDDGEGNSLTIARVTADPSVAWVGEAGTITPSDPTFGQVILTGNKLACIVVASREILNDAPNAASLIEQTVAAAMAAEIDRAILEGSGAGAEPTGILNHADVSEEEMATDGAVPTNGSAGVAGAPKLLACYTDIQTANHEPTGIISSPRTFGTFAGLADSTYQPLELPKPIAALPWRVTTNVSDTEEHGASGAVASTLYLADWTKGMLGVRQNIEVYMTRDAFLTTDQAAFLITFRGDFQPEDATAFCRLVGVLAS
jgi:HK97 family phage major capsid protein